MLRFLTLCVLSCASALVALPSCASSSSSAQSGSTSEKAAGAMRVRYVTYATNQQFVLVNPAHTDRSELYSKAVAIDEAGTKVSTDEVIDETLKWFDEKGFFDRAQPGPAPRTVQGKNPQALEVDRGGRVFHLLVSQGSSVEDRQCFNECGRAFLEIYNSTLQLQAVKEPPEWQTQNTAIKPSTTPKSSQGSKSEPHGTKGS
jgi:hypothetical protein